MNPENNIPKIPHNFFKWYCSEDKYEELHGDLEEYFYERVEEMGIDKARQLYLMDIIRCCQPYAWKKGQKVQNSIINMSMITNYFKISIRTLYRNGLYTLINIFGLSIGIICCLIILVNIN